MTVPLRAALNLRVSTARAEHDVSIPDQRKQGEAYCLSRGLELVDTFVEAGASATNDRWPEFQRMIEAGTSKPAPFDVVVVHSFSRFFRDHFELEFYVRKLAKNGVKRLSITQEMGDDPMHVMMRQIMALFDEYQSKENAKHLLRALKENARQGFWNGSLPPIGYRVVAAEQRGAAPAEKKRGFPDRKIKARAPLAIAASIVARSSRHALVGIALAAAARQIRIVAIVPHISKEKTLHIFFNVFPVHLPNAPGAQYASEGKDMTDLEPALIADARLGA